MCESGKKKEDHDREPRWKQQHAEFRQRHGLPSRSFIPAAAGQGLTQRESDIILLRHAVHPGPWPLAVDVSQSLQWGAHRARACPCFTTSSKIAIVYANASFHMLTDKQAMNFMGLRGLSIPKECSTSMTDLLGNGMHVDCAGLAAALAVSLVSAQPLAKERRMPASSTSIFFLKWQPTKNGYRVTLDATGKALKKKAALKEKAKGKRRPMKQASKNMPRGQVKDGVMGRSPKKPIASLPMKRPAASVGGTWARMYS